MTMDKLFQKEMIRLKNLSNEFFDTYQSLFDKYVKLNQENIKLKQQIEKMKCHKNCKHFEGYHNFADNLYYACKLKECEDLENWELAE
jgi:hypothetical protein